MYSNQQAEIFTELVEFPRLIGSWPQEIKLTKTWRYKKRLVVINMSTYIPSIEILKHVVQKDKQTFLKHILKKYITEDIQKKKKNRNITRNELTKIGIYHNYPQDVINTIIEFIWY
jgi:hypothetical protein